MKGSSLSTPWSELEPHVDRAFELSPAECAEWLAHLDSTEPALARDLRLVLEERDRIKASGFLEQSPPLPGGTDSLAGATVGAYTIERQIGQGGMAEVWLAARNDGRFDGRYALKFFDPSIHSTKLSERFRREGQILARLAHPNIARLFDAGATKDGRAYLVLEFIDGVRIDHYCANLPLDERVRLFTDVVAAVAHAHSHLVIHRDLKPSNVLVTVAGQVKLLDFGIAKLLEITPETGDGDRTKLSEMVLTPDYAAPEQLLGEVPATTTDVYQLGLLLYVLLTGSLPTASGGDRAGRYRATLDGRLPLASERAQDADRKHLRGDLDAILSMALRREPAERYATAQAFREDLGRYLRHEPVLARRGAAWYRVRKFVARHRIGVTASIFGLAGVCAAIGFALVQGNEAVRQRDAARRELARATAANDFTKFQLSVAPTGGVTFTAADLMKVSEELIEKQFSKDDAMRAELLSTLGSQQMNSQRWEDAARLLGRAHDIAARTDDPVLKARAACPFALMQVFDGKQVEAEKLIQQSIDELPQRAEYTQLRAECLTLSAQFGFMTGEAAPMIRDASTAIRLLESIGSESTSRYLDARGTLAWGYYLAHENKKADEIYADMVGALASAGMERTLMAADTYNNWALVHFRGDIRKAEPLLQKSVELRRLIEGPDGIAPVILHNYAGLLLTLGRYDEAVPVHQEVIRSAKARKEWKTLFDATMELSEVYLLQGEIALAEAQLAQVSPYVDHERFDRLRLAQHRYYRGHQAEIGGDGERAKASYVESTQLFDGISEKIVMNVDALCGLSRVAMSMGDQAGAADAAERAMKLANSLAEPDSPSYVVGKALIEMGEVQRVQRRHSESRASFQRARENLERTLGPAHELTRRARAREQEAGTIAAFN